MTAEPSWAVLAGAVALSLLLLALVLWLVLTEERTAAARFPRPGAGSPPADDAAPEDSPDPARRRRGAHPRAAVVVNPTKFTDIGKVRRVVERVCAEHGWAEPLWLETTVEDPGHGQTRQALAEGVDVVCAMGGDGTVRVVGSALAGSGTPMGLLPAGTGNLLARNLRLPVDWLPGDHLEAAVKVALTGRNAPIDTCALRLTRPTDAELAATPDSSPEGAPEETDDHGADGTDSTDGSVEEHTFLVMAGLGFDAEVMATTEERLKSNLGWGAYLINGARHLRGAQFRVDVSADDGQAFHRRVRSVIVGNVGKLQGGMELLPDAEADDGAMDVVLLSPEGVVGWGAVAAQLATKQRRGHDRVDHLQCRTIRIRSNKPVEIQLDGDTLGPVTAMEVEVRPASLVIRRGA
ncbi:diacylglycerol/lipid kinase family protein [Ornithinicoccus hortensis]|uniref:Diacylglycerol kinase family enzyme n=1 Tax=Ornithinicoccus hortensis TaxID=82346 RepID=A0A542YN64_9MICO|nr:diacylglycerol kinase family protein [Ornithinicoccus hortensis]TQL49545.1 diacylglycerol kinase family enzyme [Ornithinicoccus hortensis]